MRVFTYEARRWRIRLYVLLSVALNHVPELPHVAGVEDVERLARMVHAVLHVGTEQVVVGAGVPLWGTRRHLSSGHMESNFVTSI